MQDVVILSTGLRIVNELPRLYEKQGNQEFFRNLRSNTNFNNVTIEATPHEVQNLIYILATSPGSLFLTLRHPSDHTRIKLPVATMESVRDRLTSTTIKRRFKSSSI